MAGCVLDTARKWNSSGVFANIRDLQLKQLLRSNRLVFISRTLEGHDNNNELGEGSLNVMDLYLEIV